MECELEGVQYLGKNRKMEAKGALWKGSTNQQKEPHLFLDSYGTQKLFFMTEMTAAYQRSCIWNSNVIPSVR
jgi:hypothetical protein